MDPMKLTVPWVLVWACACGQDARPRPTAASAGRDATAAPVVDTSTAVTRAADPTPTGPPPAGAAVAATGPIAMTAAAARGRLTLTFTNTSAAPVTMATQFTGARLPNYDWLTVELAGPGGVRTMGFVQPRYRSGLDSVDLAPGAAHTEIIDLIEWASEGAGAVALAPGSYRVTARWDASRPVAGAPFVGVATTTMAIVAPAAGPCSNDGLPPASASHLTLLAHQAPTGRATVEVGLYNAGDTRVCVDAHIETHELQSDWLTIGYSDGGRYHHAMRVIAFDDDRDKSYPVSVLLEPGQVAWQTFDVDAWAGRKRNGSEPLPAGGLSAQAFYDSTRETRVWAGKLTSAAFELRVR